MDVSRVAGLSRVQDHEQVVRIGVELREVAALENIPDRQGVEPEPLPQLSCRVVVAQSGIDPGEAIVSLEEGRDVRPGAFFDRPGR